MRMSNVIMDDEHRGLGAFNMWQKEWEGQMWAFNAWQREGKN